MNERPQTIDDADLAAVGALLAEPARAKVLLALADGRSLAASVLASEAGVAASTASHHLAKLVDAGQITAVTRCIGTSRSRGPRNFSAIKPAPGL